MDREIWLHILRLAVVAPYLYTISDKQKNAYFRLGLKLVAGAVVLQALPPLLEKAQPLIVAAQKIAKEQAAIATANAVEGEYVEVKTG